MKNIVTCTKLTRLLLDSPCLVDLIDKLTGIGSGFAIPGNYYLYIKYKIRCGLPASNLEIPYFSKKGREYAHLAFLGF